MTHIILANPSPGVAQEAGLAQAVRNVGKKSMAFHASRRLWVGDETVGGRSGNGHVSKIQTLADDVDFALSMGTATRAGCELGYNLVERGLRIVAVGKCLIFAHVFAIVSGNRT